MEENILAMFVFPKKIVTGNAQVFKSTKLIDFCQKYNMIVGHSTTYYPQGNGLAKYSNKTLATILKQTILENQKNGDSQLNFFLWANMVTTKRSTRKSPFELVYGKDAIFPTQLAMLVAKILQDVSKEPNYLTKRIN